MSLAELQAAGIARFRKPQWSNPGAYLRIDILGDGTRGPWAHLFDRLSQEAIGEPTPQTFLALALSDDSTGWLPWDGTLDVADTRQ